MSYYILHRYNGAHHYVCIYVLSDYPLHCMPYYTHHKRAFTTMYMFMVYQTTLLSVSHITHITNIRALTTTLALMSYPIATLTECFITYFTAIWALTTMHALMYYQTDPLTEFLLHTSLLCGRSPLRMC